MKERTTIQIDKEVAETIKELYPGMSYTVALRLLLDTSKDNLKRVYRPTTSLPDNILTIEDVKAIFDKQYEEVIKDKINILLSKQTEEVKELINKIGK